MFNKDNGKRKYSCFICGIEFECSKEWKDHIIEKHEEGREYILCPLSRCQRPVRDLYLHFKNIHVHDKIPKINGPLKVLIWKDFNKKKIKKPHFKEGYFLSVKMGGKNLFFRSGYEEEVYKCLEKDNDVMAYYPEPFKIPYLWRGDTHNYTPDILIEFANGSREIIEIKPKNQTSLEQNRAKWSSARVFCEVRNIKFVILTEVGIAKMKKKNKKN